MASSRSSWYLPALSRVEDMTKMISELLYVSVSWAMGLFVSRVLYAEEFPTTFGSGIERCLLVAG